MRIQQREKAESGDVALNIRSAHAHWTWSGISIRVKCGNKGSEITILEI